MAHWGDGGHIGLRLLSFGWLQEGRAIQVYVHVQLQVTVRYCRPKKIVWDVCVCVSVVAL